MPSQYEARKERWDQRRIRVNGNWVSTVGAHGTAGTYKNHGCRCDPCKQAHTIEFGARRVARWVRTKAAGGIAAWVNKHGSAAYSNWGCQCATCLDGAATQVADRRKKGSRSG